MQNARAPSGRRVGFGLDAQYSSRYPGGLEALCDAYRDRLTHFSIVSLPDERRAEHFVARCARERPIIHHLPGIAPADPDGPKIDRLRRLDHLSRTMRAKWVCEDIAIWSIGPYGIPYFTPPIFEPDIADHIADGINRMQEASSVPFCAEVPSCSIVVGTMPMGAFFERIVRASDCHLVADVSHIYSYALAVGLDPGDVLRSLPVEHVWELHISGGHVDAQSSRRYIDTHSERIPAPIIRILKEAALVCRNLKAVTYEVGVGLIDNDISSDLDCVEAMLGEAGWSPRLE